MCPIECNPRDKVVFEYFHFSVMCKHRILHVVPEGQSLRPGSDIEAWNRACRTCRGAYSKVRRVKPDIAGYIKWFDDAQTQSFAHFTSNMTDMVMDDATLQKCLEEAIATNDIKHNMNVSAVNKVHERVVSESFKFGPYHSFHYERFVKDGAPVTRTSNEAALAMSFRGRGLHKIATREDLDKTLSSGCGHNVDVDGRVSRRRSNSLPASLNESDGSQTDDDEEDQQKEEKEDGEHTKLEEAEMDKMALRDMGA